MSALRRLGLVVLLCGLCCGTVGCAKVWHNLQPYRLHQLNRGPGMTPGAKAYSLLSEPPSPVC